MEILDSSVVLWAAAVLGAGCIAAVWIRTCDRRPLMAFGWLLFLTVTTHDRLRSGYFLGDNGQGHGSVSVADLAWLLFVVAVTSRLLRKRPLLLGRFHLPRFAWIGLPYVVMSVALPIMGGLVGFVAFDWPVSYVSTGIRHLQWLSFAGIAYWLGGRHGVSTTLATVTRSFIAAGLAHAAYGLLQLGVRFGVLPQAWRALDDFHAAGGASWLHDSARLTGLFVMPTAYGNLGAVLSIVGFILLVSRSARLGAPWAATALGAGGFIVIMSGDRVALAALIAALVVAASASVTGGYRIIKIVVLLPLLPIAALALTPLYPGFVRNRFNYLLESTSQGLWTVQNVAERFERWRYYLDVVVPAYPLGTWVQPRFIGGMTPDSYFITVLAQGSVAFLLAFVCFICCLLLLGRSVLACTQSPATRWLGVLLTAIATFVSVAALGGSVMFDVTILVVLWTCTGMAILLLRLARRMPLSNPA
jgi:hypothetical protein